MKYRVQYRQRATDAWQTSPATSAQDARQQARGYQRRFWQAVVQWWSEPEGRWIG